MVSPPLRRFIFCGTFRKARFDRTLPAVSRHAALWRPDFPPLNRGGHPSGKLHSHYRIESVTNRESMNRSRRTMKKLLLPLLALSCLQGQKTGRIHSVKVTVLSTMLADAGIGEWGFSALVTADGRQ